MKLRYLGYPCTNVTLGATTGRTLRLANLKEPRLSAVIRENLATLRRLLLWNVERGIRFFRVASSVIPLASHEAFPLDWPVQFAPELAEVRALVAEHHLRLSMHPGQYTILNAQRPEVVAAAVRELEYHAAFLAATDPRSGTMTLHVGGAYGDKGSAKRRFAENAALLSPEARSRLILENDDRTFHAGDVLELCEALQLPMVFDFLHHKLNPVSESWEAELVPLLARAVATWDASSLAAKVPKFHLSSPRDLSTAHADFVEPVDFLQVTDALAQFGGDAPFDLMLEAKQKDAALLRLLRAPELRGVISAAH
ncbi:UV DNA damage repair endonuclease UvsE [Truepera radiovictrix]|uniref:UV-endonuclease UvdE n=1 Tax=Truepera radiovictrix (strain DSM 17093 / CIP 108686 / LMG 22925 / RQ-24) TaxID=649638 RepID=D7CSW4_TRURR|nr:UV DNA damage repair endonuclease UvsE [Truepera radiovictrix]ADI13731.1 UV-endonuclease UvdE [Truepera radiovictrix DSM 17093]WMT57704.1 UV DNA damage repair endonuclease UvsE [Truepera radiovictrix]